MWKSKIWEHCRHEDRRNGTSRALADCVSLILSTDAVSMVVLGEAGKGIAKARPGLGRAAFARVNAAVASLLFCSLTSG